MFCVYEKAEVLKNNLTYYGLGKEFGSIQMFPLSLSIRPSELSKERAATQVGLPELISLRGLQTSFLPLDLITALPSGPKGPELRGRKRWPRR